jgi:hypothetical protein
MYGVAGARCLNELKEYYWDPTFYSQRRIESNRDWWNFDQGVRGRHREADGQPDSTHLIPDPAAASMRHYLR